MECGYIYILRLHPLTNPSPINYLSKTILLIKLPIPSTSISTSSPSPTKPLGSMNNPTPLGVPVIMAVPALSVVPLDKCSTICATVQIISSVPVSCLFCPLTFVVYFNFCGSGITSLLTMTGPIGAKLSKDLAYPNWPPDIDAGNWKLRADTSLPIV